MSPPTTTFPLSDLSSQINVLPSGKPRHPPINLEKDCVLKELVQYKCNLEGTDKKGGPDIICQPVVRLLRQ
jgi:inner membrane protease subunit SOM1